jgi:hypothetical protein
MNVIPGGEMNLRTTATDDKRAAGHGMVLINSIMVCVSTLEKEQTLI